MTAPEEPNLAVLKYTDLENLLLWCIEGHAEPICFVDMVIPHLSHLTVLCLERLLHMANLRREASMFHLSNEAWTKLRSAILDEYTRRNSPAIKGKVAGEYTKGSGV